MTKNNLSEFTIKTKYYWNYETLSFGVQTFLTSSLKNKAGYNERFVWSQVNIDQSELMKEVILNQTASAIEKELKERVEINND